MMQGRFLGFFPLREDLDQIRNPEIDQIDFMSTMAHPNRGVSLGRMERAGLQSVPHRTIPSGLSKCSRQRLSPPRCSPDVPELEGDGLLSQGGNSVLQQWELVREGNL